MDLPERHAAALQGADTDQGHDVRPTVDSAATVVAQRTLQQAERLVVAQPTQIHLARHPPVARRRQQGVAASRPIDQGLGAELGVDGRQGLGVGSVLLVVVQPHGHLLQSLYE